MKNSISKLNKKLSKKGLSSEEWAILVDLRKEQLVSMNRNPDCFELGSRGVELKNYYKPRKHLTYLNEIK
jgi:hypothetical protein